MERAMLRLLSYKNDSWVAELDGVFESNLEHQIIGMSWVVKLY